MFERLLDLFQGTIEFGGMPRSPSWRRVRQEHIKKHPRCAVSGKKTFVQVHHIKPFHLFPELELEPSNLVTLSRWHHLWFGHLGSWRSYNDNLLKDIERVKNRP